MDGAEPSDGRPAECPIRASHDRVARLPHSLRRVLRGHAGAALVQRDIFLLLPRLANGYSSNTIASLDLILLSYYYADEKWYQVKYKPGAQVGDYALVFYKAAC